MNDFVLNEPLKPIFVLFRKHYKENVFRQFEMKVHIRKKKTSIFSLNNRGNTKKVWYNCTNSLSQNSAHFSPNDFLVLVHNKRLFSCEMFAKCNVALILCENPVLYKIEYTYSFAYCVSLRFIIFLMSFVQIFMKLKQRIYVYFLYSYCLV